MDKKLYIQPSSREVITQLKSVFMDPSVTIDGEKIPIEEGDGDGDAKLRDEWSENGLW
ncbi:MAG: hypothetical protein II400_10410 [Bacteroidaceae bacterium]|nr:hypothetical protein [Bacteroidaceae bacterium]